MIDKKCWMCKRTNEEVKKEVEDVSPFDDSEYWKVQNEINDWDDLSSNYFQCIVCHWIIYQSMARMTDDYSQIINNELETTEMDKIARIKEILEE